MTYCETYFNKPLRELAYEDIVAFFQVERQENETLEFKSGRGEFDTVLTKGIIKGISAFLNSSGGVLIWGAPVEKTRDRDGRKICIGDLFPVSAFIEKDRLINRISSSISYMPTGVKVATLELAGRYLYVFEIKESAAKPHQYAGCYYIRLDGQSKPSPHYLVDALFKQIKFPDLEAKISVIVHENVSGSDIEIDITVSIFNNSSSINAKSIGYHIGVDKGKFEDTDGSSSSYQSASIVPRWLGISNKHKVLLHKLNDDYEMTIFIKFFSESSPLKMSVYDLLIDKVYLEPRLTVVQENTLADEFYELTDKFVKSNT